MQAAQPHNRSRPGLGCFGQAHRDVDHCQSTVSVVACPGCSHVVYDPQDRGHQAGWKLPCILSSCCSSHGGRRGEFAHRTQRAGSPSQCSPSCWPECSRSQTTRIQRHSCKLRPVLHRRTSNVVTQAFCTSALGTEGQDSKARHTAWRPQLYLCAAPRAGPMLLDLLAGECRDALEQGPPEAQRWLYCCSCCPGPAWLVPGPKARAQEPHQPTGSMILRLLRPISMSS